MKRSPRFYFALLFAKATARVMKLIGRKGTSMPGSWAIILCPDFLGRMPRPKTIIGITGTNGKTTVSNLVEDILTAEEERPVGALRIAILEQDDVDLFAQEQYAIRDALCLWSDVPELMEAALRVYQGRAFYDGTADLDPEVLERLRQTYGLILL